MTAETPPGGGLREQAAAMARSNVWTEEQLIADVDAAPPGRRVGAFFDFDGTVIDGYSLAAFARHHLRSLEVTPTDLGQLLLTGLRGVTTEDDFERFTVSGMRAWAGRSEDELAELGERLFVQGIAGSLYPEAWRLVTAHLQAGHTVVLASSATRFQVEPAARALGVEHVLVSPVEIVDGVCTGRPGGPLLWRAGKAAAVRAFAEEHGIDLLQSYAYSNGDEDVPFLRTVGRARALNPGRGLTAAARHYSWPVARFRRRGRTGAADLARTVAGIGGMFGGFTTGLAVGALGGSRREAVDLGLTLAGELGSALAGVRLDVQGAEHLATRPAVFLFNHQSQLDVLILAKLLRGGFTGVAKKELARTPGFGLAFRLADVAFVDRSDPAQARRALEPAVQRLQEGISLVIAPEGTRSATPTLGPFKKGAFHVAMQAGVPIVPVVIRNAGELMWRGATVVTAGTVQVRVLPPVPTTGWRAEDVDRHVTDVRDSFLATLANWSGRTQRPVVAESPTADDGVPAPAVPAAPLDWGTSPEMNPIETAMWRAEAADPRLRANVTLLEILETAPGWDRFRGAHEWASRMVPRMRQRVVEPALGVGAPRWVTIEDLDLDRHVHRVRLEEPGSMRQLLAIVGEFSSALLDRDRPLWEVMLVEGLADGRAAYVVKTHHSTTDGLGAVQLMGLLHRRGPETDPARPEPPAPVPGEVSRVGALTEQLVGTARSVPLAALRRGVEALGALRHPREVAAQALDAARAATKTLAPPRGSSPLLAPRGGDWRFEVLEVPLADLKAGSKAAGGSLNDGFLAAVLGGFRRYHERSGAPLGTMTIGIPISLRARDDAQGGNRFTGARFTAPLDEADAAARVSTIREFVLSARETSTSGVTDDLLGPALHWIPASVVGAVSGRLTGANDVQVSNMPGVTHPVWIAGSRILRMFPFGPLPGCAAMVTLLSHEDTCCIGVNLDAAAVTDPAGLVADLQAGLDEVVALGRR
ncbi:HAD-superfamily subfamily IB hydrolase, TIGR01490 [Geodermatophilus amargosae]|uniref:1-acyl-sn-glycerol-3-phosphate acyltransferase n=1 Tax=Geodermatophilus amargosae TaxID=1296565 RepID=A0A1I7CQY5_9ACTN|nr:HAD-IB family hydrolase [Geodermatophilus amargosae]SFU01784.1 HAD-superfamily subfamily IB hydrolase, TIGR01490 [Geodermatophilus amargosae]